MAWVSVQKFGGFGVPFQKQQQQRPFHHSAIILRADNNEDSSLNIDEYGRRIRRRPNQANDRDRRLRNNDDDDKNNNDSTLAANAWSVVSPRNTFSPSRQEKKNMDDGSWSAFNPLGDTTTTTSINNNNNYNRRSTPRLSRRVPYQEQTREEESRFNRGRPNRSRTLSSQFSGSNRYRRQDDDASTAQSRDDQRINMRALEGAGFVHLYGLASTLNALQANRRDFTQPDDEIDLESLQGEQYEREIRQRPRKPEAQFSPWLFLQTGTGENRSTRATSKVAQADRVKDLAEQRGVPIAYVDKGVLNSLSNNRPHQGYVLRCGSLAFESMPRLPSLDEEEPGPKLWLALDEVVDPQNLGALLRSAYFLGGANDGSDHGRATVRVLVCAKNSAPPSPVVSAASAGALEMMNVYSTNNLHKTLTAAELDGYRIIGAESNVPKNLAEVPIFNLQDLQALDPNQPTILVLGSEGHGIRNLVATACTEFVRIPGSGNPRVGVGGAQKVARENDGDETEDDDDDTAGGSGGVVGVDSLNVSVTGGILLWHLLHSK